MTSELREILARSNGIPEPVDITDRFFAECAKLSLGEVVFMPDYRLHEAMSAVELMEPKMDVGMERFTRKVGVQALIDQGYFEKISNCEVLTIIDATFATLVAYLSGANISNSIYTNMLVVEPDLVPNRPLAAIAKSFVYLVPLIRSIVSTAIVAEEEDFHYALPYALKCTESLDDVYKLMKDVEQEMKAKSSDAGSDKYILLATAAHLEWLRLFMDTISMLTPQLHCECHDLDIAKPKVDFRKAVQQAEKLTQISSVFVQSAKLGRKGPSVADGLDSDSADGNYDWIPVFEPELNRLFLTGSFPRKTITPSREKAMLYIYNLSCRVLRIASESTLHATDYLSFVDFYKTFAIDGSCCFTRSLLQLTMIPNNDIIIGDSGTSLGDLVEITIRNNVKPLVVIDGSPVESDKECQNIYADFVDEFTRASLTLISTFGMNLARQRERLAVCIEEMVNSQVIAEDVDQRTSIITKNTNYEDNPMRPITAFVFNQIVAIIDYHIQLSFRLQLFSTHEFPFVYWYFGEIVSRWSTNALERQKEVYLHEFKAIQTQKALTSKSKKKPKHTKTEELLRKKVDTCHAEIYRHFGESSVAIGISKTTMALIKLDKVKCPVWDSHSEEHRFEHRMAPFKILGPPFHLTFEQYCSLSRKAETSKASAETLIKEAVDCFEIGMKNFDQLKDREEYTKLAEEYMRVCKTNIIAAKILCASGKQAGRHFDWTFSDDFCIFPILKLS